MTQQPAQQQKKESLPLKTVLKGSALILISNLIYISNNYLVVWTELKASEIALVRGALQLLVFGSLVWWRSWETDKDSGSIITINCGFLLTSLITEPKPNRAFLYLLLCLYGFTASTASFAVLSSIPLMPIGDLIVISFTSPVFSVFLDRLVLKRSLTVLSIFLCLFIVIGDVLVVQPPFIFPKEESENNATKNHIRLEDGTNIKKHGEHYFLGVALCLYTAAAVSIANVVGAQCNKMAVSTSTLMLVSGCSSLLLSLISTPFLSNRVLMDPQSLTLQAAVPLLPSDAFTSPC